MNHSANYAKHATVAANDNDRVTLTYARGEAASGSVHEGVRSIPAQTAPLMVCNRHATAGLWIDFTYPDGGSPGSVTPGADDTFYVPPLSEFAIRSQYPVWEVVLAADEDVPYSIMVVL